MADGKVVIEIDADSGGLEKSLEEAKTSATSAVAAIEKKTAATTKDTGANNLNSKSMESVARRATEAGASFKSLGDQSTETGSHTDALQRKYENLSTKVSAAGKTVDLFDAKLSLNDSQLKGNGNQVSTLRERQALLEEAVAASKSQVQLLGEQLSTATRLYGENSAEVTGLQIELTDAKTREQEFSNQLKETTETIREKTDAVQLMSKRLKDAGETATATGEKIASVGVTLTKGVTAPVIAAGTAAVKLGSDYEENLNKVDASFKQNAGEVERWAKTATDNFGLSESKALEVTSQFGDMGTSMGLTTEAAAVMSTSLAGLAGDLSSFKNIGVDQAMTALNGVFTGETESLKTLGVVMTETNLKQFAEDCGLVYDGMSQAEKVTLRYKYVLAMTKNAQGDYKATSDGTANSLRTLQSSVSNLGAAFGQKLLPKITPIIQYLTKLVNTFGSLDDSTQEFIIKAALVAAAAGPVTTAVGKTTSVIGKLITITGRGVSATGRFASVLTGTGAAATEAAVGATSAATATGSLGSALTAALGTGGAAALAVAGLTAAAAGAAYLAVKADEALDPVIQLGNAIDGVTAAQETMASSGNIIELAERYQTLRSKMADASLTASEMADVQSEMADVRAQLSGATNGAVSAEGELNGALDETVALQKTLAELEAQRAKEQIYQELKDGADDYQKALSDLRKTQVELAEAEERMKTTQEALANGSDAAYQKLQSTLDGVRDSLDDGLIDTSTVEGTAQLNAELKGLEDQVNALVTTGEQVHFDTFAEAEAYIENMAYSTEDAGDAAQGAVDDYNDLKDQLDDLTDATTEYEDMVLDLVRSGLLPTRDATVLLGITEEELSRKLTTSEQKSQKASDATEDLAEEHLAAAKAAKEQQEAEQEATQSLAKVGIKAYEAVKAGGELRTAYEELSKEAEKYTEDADAEIAADAERALYKLNLAATNQELGASYSSMGLEVNSSLASMAEYLISTGVSVDEFESGVSSMRDSVVNNFQSIKNENALTADEIVKNLDSNLKAQQAWSQNLSDMWEQAYSDQDAQVMAFINYLAQKGPDYAAEVQSFANAGYSKLQEAASIWSQTGEQSASDYAAGIWMQEYVAGLAGEGMAQAALDSASGVDVSGAGQQLTEDFASGVSGQESEVTAAGQNVGEALVTGLESQGASLKTSAAALATAAINIWMAKAGTFRTAGATAATSLAGGISSGSGTVSSAASSVAYAAQNAMRIGGWYNLGYNISAGVADGVSAGSYLITRAAQNAAQNALNAAKATLGVHSPSRVFRDQVGQMIPAGMAEGITLGAPKATAAVEFTADQLLAATRVALRPSGSMTGAQYVNNTISNSYFGGSSGGNIVLEAPVYLDGREIARASAKYTGRQMAYLEGL